MTPEELQELKEKAELWDSLSDSLRTIFCGKFDRPKLDINGKVDYGLTQKGITTIENISNSSTHIDVLREEFNEGLCSCHLKKCEFLTQNNN
jgi:hypothetical protein